MTTNTYPVTIRYYVTKQAQIDALASGEVLSEVQAAEGQVDLETVLKLGFEPNRAGQIETHRNGHLWVVGGKLRSGYPAPPDWRIPDLAYPGEQTPFRAKAYDSVQSFEAILADYFVGLEERKAVAEAEVERRKVEAEEKRRAEIAAKLARVDFLEERNEQLEETLREVYRLNEDAGPGSRRAVRDAIKASVEIEEEEEV